MVILLHVVVCMVVAICDGSPHLTLSKHAGTRGEDDSVYRVNITVYHSSTSSNDVFNVTVVDQVYEMDVGIFLTIRDA